MTARVLVIDDEEDIRIVLKEVFSRAGFDVDVAANSSAGIEKLRKRPADLVVIDVIMPGMDGVTAAREIRGEFPETRIIVISGGGNISPKDYEPSAIKTEAYLASASAAGADLTLTKPFDRQALIDAARELTGQEG